MIGAFIGVMAGADSPLVASSADFFVQPGGAVAGVPFTQQPVVRLLDQHENPMLDFTGPVEMSISSGTGTLSGTTTVNAVAGVATFTDLELDLAGDFSLNASIDAFGLGSDIFHVD